jgi:hypothetical protein
MTHAMRQSRNDLFPGFCRFLDFLLAVTILVPLIGAALLFWVLTTPSHSRELYPGQYAQVPDNIRSWFKGVRSPNGVPCCDMADGHSTIWRHGQESDANSGYEVPINDQWTPVPRQAVVNNAGNPTDSAIVWYVRQGDNSYYIRCFVPGDGV